MSKNRSYVSPPPHSWAGGVDTFMEAAGSTSVCPCSPGCHPPPLHLHSHQAASLPLPFLDWLPPAPFACPSLEIHSPNGKEGLDNLNCLPLLTLLLFLLYHLHLDFCLCMGNKLLLICVLENPCPRSGGSPYSLHRNSLPHIVHLLEWPQYDSY